MDADLETTPASALENDDAGMEEDFDYNADDIGKEIKLTDDGGVIKKILVKGEGWETPEKGDEVQVHYIGTLNSDGSKFDSSRDRDEIFKFKLGLGQVIKGWDTGVASMKKGEKAILTCRADYAYGESGSPPKIPPNATLDFEVELLGWRSIKDISGDGGVIKTILEEGEGWDHPRGRDEVLVHYTAKLPGAEAPFAQSPDEGTSFTLEEGHLCPGLGTALESMKKGEKANLQLKPSYAFGESGNEALGVPADSNVEVSLRLVSWKKVEDVTDDGLVVKKALEVDPDEYKRPNEGATVTLRLTGRLPGGDVFEAYGEGNELVVKTCEEKMCEGLELAVMKMKRGEKALVTISDAKYGFGAAGRPAAGEGLAAVPANTAPLTYAVQLVAFENAKETWEMTEDEKVEAAKERKEKGNAYFKAANYKRAINFWDKAVNLVSYDKSMTPDQQAQVKDIKRSCWLNMAQVALKEQRWKDALTNCNKVLEADTTNVKALYRRAQAHKELQDYLEALLDVKKALELEPGNTDVKKLEQNIKVLQRQQNKKEAAMYSKMFSAKAAAAALDTAAAPDTGANTDAPATEQTATA